jgi:hypothetical protein
MPANRRPVRVLPGTLMAFLELRHHLLQQGLVTIAGCLRRGILCCCLAPVRSVSAVSASPYRVLKGRPVAVGVRLSRRHSRRLRALRLRGVVLGCLGLVGLDLLMFLVQRMRLWELLYTLLLRRHGLLELLNAPLRSLGFLQPLLSVLRLLELPRPLLRVLRRPAVVAPWSPISGSVGPACVGRRNDEFADGAHPALPVHHGMAGEGNTPGTEQYG